MKVLMVGVDEKSIGGMWTVVKNYLNDKEFCSQTHLMYIPTTTSASTIRKIIFSAKALCKIIKVLFYKDIDIIHIHMSEKGSVFREGLVVLLGKIMNSKVIIHMHGASFEDWYKNRGIMLKCIIKFIINTADKFIILGEYCKEFFGEIIRNRNKIVVLHNAITIPDFRNYNKNGNEIIFLGMLIKRKGIDDLLKAIHIIKNELPDSIIIKLYGADKDNNVNEKIKLLDLEGKVNYCGWLNRNMQKDCFSKAILNILPSYNEGLPMTILETMAYGIPNISTNIAGIPEVISNRNGILVKAGDINSLSASILKLVNDESLRESFSINAYNDVKEKFNINVHIKNLMKIYDEIASV